MFSNKEEFQVELRRKILLRQIFIGHRARKICEFHLVRWANNPQILLARGTSSLAQVFKLINNS